MMTTANQLLTALAGHIGKGNGVSAKVLAARLGFEDTRPLRKLISQAIETDRVAICGTPRDGYYIAANAEELLETIEFHDHRAKHELAKAGQLRRMLGDLFGQMHVPT
jgi:hypothetical protein